MVARLPQRKLRKARRYGVGSGGISVTPFAIETWGRLGDAAVELLAKLAAHWANAESLGPAATAAKGRRWMAELGVALARPQAATAAQASATVAIRRGDSDLDDE